MAKRKVEQQGVTSEIKSVVFNESKGLRRIGKIQGVLNTIFYNILMGLTALAWLGIISLILFVDYKVLVLMEDSVTYMLLFIVVNVIILGAIRQLRRELDGKEYITRYGRR